MSQKRNRSINWDEEEKVILMLIVKRPRMLRGILLVYLRFSDYF